MLFFIPICALLFGIQEPASPGSSVIIEVFKQERTLYVRLAGEPRSARFSVCALSGIAGPKERAGDLQVPEGFYRVRSRAGSSLQLDYPNALDRAMGRTGGGIAIHRGCGSIGCIGLTDIDMQELLVVLRRLSDDWRLPIAVQIAPSERMGEFLSRNRESRYRDFWLGLVRDWHRGIDGNSEERSEIFLLIKPAELYYLAIGISLVPNP